MQTDSEYLEFGMLWNANHSEHSGESEHLEHSGQSEQMQAYQMGTKYQLANGPLCRRMIAIKVLQTNFVCPQAAGFCD